jgi:homoserine O-acetyltransferase
VVQAQVAHFNQPLTLRGGGVLPAFTLAYETYGTLNADRTNAILICHALSGDAHVAGYHTTDPDEPPGWWDDAVGPGKMFDTDRYFVLCSNVIGGCRGSTGPASPAPDGQPWGARFPVVTVADMVRAQTHLLDHLGIERLYAVAGGSMGGMQALEWAASFPQRVANVLFIASTPRSTPLNIALNEVGRQAILTDPHWRGGHYYDQPTRPDAGLAIARMIGHISYLSDASFERKFGRRFQHGNQPRYAFETDFAVEGYLQHQGEKFVRRFDANSYLYITKALDYFDISDGYGSFAEAFVHVHDVRFLVVTFESDWLYPAEASVQLAEALDSLGLAVEYHHVPADGGHDSFLIEVGSMARIIGGFLSTGQAAGAGAAPTSTPASASGAGASAT